jgi:hypothetical protein
VSVGTGVSVGVAVGVLVGTGVSVGTGVAVGAEVGETLGVGELLGEGEGVNCANAIVARIRITNEAKNMRAFFTTTLFFVIYIDESIKTLPKSPS